MRHIFIIPLVFLALFSFGVNAAPQILRACLNTSDSIVTISWKPVNDLCGSFTQYSIYASSKSGPFIKLDDIPNIMVAEYPHKLSNRNTEWRYYITVDTDCSGSTVFSTDTVPIDIINPNNIQLDSVSYNITTQKVIAGWPQNKSPDTKLYYILDYSSGDGETIGTTVDTNYIVSDARSGRFPVAIRTADSCNKQSLDSRQHTASFLNATIDTCLREISLNWDRYIGWNTIDSQSLYVSFDGAKFTKDTTFDGTISNSLFTKFVLGDTISFYIRSYTSNGEITTSSNIRTISTREFIVPEYVYLSLATVYDGIGRETATPSITWETDNVQDVSQFSISRDENIGNLLFIRNLPSTQNQLTYTFDDLTQNAKLKSFTYQVAAVDKCGDILQTSKPANTIHLSLLPDIVHNEYINWDVGVRDYDLQKHNGSTWNTILTQSTPFGFTEYLDSTGCYKVVANEIVNQYNFASISYSNIVCIKKKLRYEVTTGVNPNTENNKFLVIGEGIDHNRSSYSIFNRWGEMLVHNPTNIPWYADYKGNPVEPGVYVYVADIFGELGEKETIKGVVNVIR